MAEKNGPKAEEIMAIATKLFAERGYEGVSVRDICSSLGANCSIISYYFGGKAGLYREILKQQLRSWEELLERTTVDGADSRQDFENFFEDVLRLRRQSPAFASLMLRESVFPSAAYKDVLKEHRKKYGDPPVELIRNGQRRGVFKSSVKAEHLTRILIHLFRAPLGKNKQEEDEFCRTIKTVFLSGSTASAEAGEPERAPGKKNVNFRANSRL